MHSIAFSSDGTCMVSGSDDQSVLIWNMNTGDIKHVVKGHSSAMKSVSQMTGHV